MPEDSFRRYACELSHATLMCYIHSTQQSEPAETTYRVPPFAPYLFMCIIVLSVCCCGPRRCLLAGCNRQAEAQQGPTAQCISITQYSLPLVIQHHHSKAVCADAQQLLLVTAAQSTSCWRQLQAVTMLYWCFRPANNGTLHSQAGCC
jgi:hypothetical protein